MIDYDPTIVPTNDFPDYDPTIPPGERIQDQATIQERPDIADEYAKKPIAADVPKKLLSVIVDYAKAMQMYRDAEKIIAKLQAEYLSVIQREAEITRLKATIDTEFSAWCADYTENLTGEVATFEVPGEVDPTIGGGINIKPGFTSAAWSNDDGQIQLGTILSAAAFAWNFTLLQPWMKWMPHWRYATILSIDIDTDRMAVQLAPIISKSSAYLARDLTLNDPWEAEMMDVRVDYMNCNALAFSAGDQVIVQFRLESSGALEFYTPYVIGFKSNPVNCATIAFIFYPRTIGHLYGIYNQGSTASNIDNDLLFASLKVTRKEDNYSFKSNAPESAKYGNQFFFFDADVYSWWHSSAGDGPIVSDYFYDFSDSLSNTGYYHVMTAQISGAGPKFIFITPSGDSYPIYAVVYKRGSPFFIFDESGDQVISGFWIGDYVNTPINGLTNKNQRCLVSITYLSPSIYTEIRAYRIDQDAGMNNVFTDIAQQSPFRLYPFADGEVWEYFVQPPGNPPITGPHGFWPVRFNENGTQCATLYCSSVNGDYNEGVRDFVETIVVDIEHQENQVIFTHSVSGRSTNTYQHGTIETQVIDRTVTLISEPYQTGSNTVDRSSYDKLQGARRDGIAWPIAVDYNGNAELIYSYLEANSQHGTIYKATYTEDHYDFNSATPYGVCQTCDEGDMPFVDIVEIMDRVRDWSYSEKIGIISNNKVIFPHYERPIDADYLYRDYQRTGYVSQVGGASSTECAGYEGCEGWMISEDGGDKEENMSRSEWLNQFNANGDYLTATIYPFSIRYINLKKEIVFYATTSNSPIQKTRTGEYSASGTFELNRVTLDVYPSSYTSSNQLDDEKRATIAEYEKETEIFNRTYSDYQAGASSSTTTIVDPILKQYPSYAVWVPIGGSYNETNTVNHPETAINLLWVFSGYNKDGMNISHSLAADDRGIDFNFPSVPWAASYSVSDLHQEGAMFGAETASSFGTLNSKIFYLDNAGQLDLENPVDEASALMVYPIGLQ